MGIKTHSIAVLITTCISSVKFIIINKYCYYYCYLPPAHISHSSQQTKGTISGNIVKLYMTWTRLCMNCTRTVPEPYIDYTRPLL